MVDAEALIDSALAHVVAIVLGVVGLAALVTGTVGGAAWFWLFYLIIWAVFLDLFDDSSWWTDDEDDREEVETEVRETTEDPLSVLKQRYAAGEIDDAEFEARLDALLETPDTLAELETERN